MRRLLVLLYLILLLATTPTVTAAVIDVDLARFATTKQAQTRELAQGLTNSVPSYVWSFFDALQVDDWETATNLAARLYRASGRYSADTNLVSLALASIVWQPIHETIGAYEQFHNWDNKWLHRFGSEIINSIPRGSIFFGGTDPGRFLITALSESHRDGKPFYTVTQNQLADGLYLEYLRAMYGGKLYMPSVADSQKAFQEYLADAQDRLKAGKLKPGEDVRINEGRVQASGQVAVMTINGLIAKVIADKNPDREVFVEESFPLDWMYPLLSPHGLIMKLEKKPISQFREEILAQDRSYWQRLMREFFGDRVTEQTSVKQVCDFAEKIHLQKDFKEFQGDLAFVKNEEARKCFSKLRSSIGGLYAWRVEQAKDNDERDRMYKAAELAFQQAFIICPLSPEAVFRYCNLLAGRARISDAVVIASTALRFDPEQKSLQELVRSLRSRE